MQLPSVEPLKENIIVMSKEGLAGEIREVLERSSGLFLKVFTKDRTAKYYFTLLIGRRKIIAAEGEVVDTGEKLVGAAALKKFLELMGNPMIVDIFELDEISLKISIADNIDMYNATPKIDMDEFLRGRVPEGKAETPAPPAPAPKKKEAPPVKKEPEKPKVEKPKVEAPPKPAEAEKEEKAPETRVNIEVEGPAALKEVVSGALYEYLGEIENDIEKLKDVILTEATIHASIGSGIVHVAVDLKGQSLGGSTEADVAKRKVLYFVNRHLPVIGRNTGLKPFLDNVSVEISGVGKEFTKKPVESRPKKEEEARIIVNAPNEYRAFFMAFSKNAIKDLDSPDFKVTHFEVTAIQNSGFEVNIFVKGRSATLSHAAAASRAEGIIKNHLRNLSREIRLSTKLNYVDVVVERAESPAPAGAPSPGTAATTVQPAVEGSEKVREIMEKKRLIEAEVEKLLKEAGVEDLAAITEVKKEESAQTLIKSRIEPAMNKLKSTIQSELSTIPRTKFRWLKMNWEIVNNTVEVSFEVSFGREAQEGLFGSFSTVSDEAIKKDARETILRIMREVGREHGVVIKLKDLKVIVR